jgi:N-acetylglucosamine-6-phosphate deacetylase
MSETIDSEIKDSISGISSPEENNIGASMPPAHRVSIIPSVSSGSIAPVSQPYNKPASMSLKRYVSGISSSDDEPKRFKASHVARGGRLTQFSGARILQRDGSLIHGSITVDQVSGLIVDISLDADGEEKHEEDLMQISDHASVEVINCRNQIISPGFIDIQLNGAYGVDFSNSDVASNGLTVEDMFEVAHKLLSTGCTSFCPTMVSSARETYRRIIPLVREARDQQSKQKSTDKKRGANILGMHLEGPFFAPSKRGAHDNTHIFAPTKGVTSVIETYGLDATTNNHFYGSRMEDIDIITMAPELDGALDSIKSLTTPNNGHSVVISCGHTEATYEDGVQAVESGATLLTHLYNAMNPFHHRKPGLVGLLSSELKLSRSGLERPFYSMIVDGIHVHEAAVSMAYNSHPHGKLREM